MAIDGPAAAIGDRNYAGTSRLRPKMGAFAVQTGVCCLDGATKSTKGTLSGERFCMCVSRYGPRHDRDCHWHCSFRGPFRTGGFDVDSTVCLGRHGEGSMDALFERPCAMTVIIIQPRVPE